MGLLALLLGTRSYWGLLASLRTEQGSGLVGWRPSLLGARTLLGAPGLTTRNKKLLGAPGIATNGARKWVSGLEAISIRSKDALLGAPGLTTRKEQGSGLVGWRPSLLGARTLLGAPGLTTRNKKLLGAPGIATRSKEVG